MNTSSTSPAAPADAPGLRARLALAIVAFLIAATLPYLWLTEHFGYDDILREPAATILVNFHQGGAPLVAAWLAFAMAGLAFIPVAMSLQRLATAHGKVGHGVLILGICSAVAQTVGLLRWVLVVPALASGYADPASTPARQEALLAVFDATHRFGGMVLGEMVGQLLLAGWTAGVALQLWRARVVPRWLAAAGALTVPLWLLGQTELLHPVLPALPLVEAAPLAFIGWQAWLAALAVALLATAVRNTLDGGDEHGYINDPPMPAQR